MNENIIKIKDENGNIKDAKVINTINIDNEDYILYYIEEGNNNSNLFASKVILDKDNNIQYEDLKEDEKAKIITYIQNMLKD